MPVFSDDTATLQDEWMAELGGTVSELQSVVDEACRHHEGYLAALSRMGGLYAHCGRLMVRANNPNLAMHHQIDAAADARRVVSQLKLSIEQWRDSSDELALRAFLQNQREQWKMWEDEVRHSFEHNKQRKSQSATIDEVRRNSKRFEKSNPVLAKDLKLQLQQLEAARQSMDTRVRRDLAESVKLCSRDLIKFGTHFIDNMSKSGQACAVSFQPIGFSDVDLSPPKKPSTSTTRRNIPQDTVLGVVLHRPSPRDVVDGSVDSVDGVSYTRSYTYQRDATMSSPTVESSCYRDPCAT
ncbi:hypothetical protein ABL78_6964 [Leptomonas seymouri]|uniref:Uncharacterized protein n=1 Tax=Leptomonas seymouri TaxID=5684 RepID=A0A0N0P3D2_LEPSE|nr:hypothetical protein ABL78_6964 [Leptomonas seymouri]|eukprot:KPI83989.1 hypothetical protein ABL78_6964 [Leptomonas seymouri]